MSRPAVIVDIDGTLVDVSGIRHYVLDDPRNKNFQKFHAAASYVTPMPQVSEIVRDLYLAMRQLGYDPVLAIDDNPIVVQLWRSLDIPTVVVPGWVVPPKP